MNSTNKLGLTAALITALVLAVVFGAWWAVRKTWFPLESSTSSLLRQGYGGQADQDVSQDSDGDGLADLIENLYQTDISNPDTDGDGVNDGQEVQAGRNPTLAEAAGESGGLAVGSEVAGENTWTAKYLATLPDDTPQEQILDKARLEAFVNVNKGELLPSLPAGLVKTTSASGKEAVAAYLDQVSPVQNKNLSAVTNEEIETAWRAAYQNNRPQELEALIRKLHGNVDVLEEVEAPAELKDLHTKVVGAAHALVNNTELLRDMNQDFVGGLIGAKNIEELGSVFQEIEAEFDRLDTQYNL